MIVCVCNNVTEAEIRGAIGLGVRTGEELSVVLGVAVNCGACKMYVESLVKKYGAAPSHEPSDDRRTALAGASL